MHDPYLSPPSDPAEIDAFLGQLGRIAVALAGGLVMAFLGAGFGSWLGLGPPA